MAAFPWVFWRLGTCLLTINIYCRTSSLCQSNTGQEKPFPLLPHESFSVSSLALWKGVRHFKPKVKGNSVNSENHSAALGHLLRQIKPCIKRAAWGSWQAWGASLPLLPPSNPSNSLVGPSDGVGFLAFWLAALLKGFHGHPLQGQAPGRAFVLQPSRMGRGSLSLCTCHPPPCDGLPPHLCPITAAPVCTRVPISPPSSCFVFFFLSTGS